MTYQRTKFFRATKVNSAGVTEYYTEDGNWSIYLTDLKVFYSEAEALSVISGISGASVVEY